MSRSSQRRVCLVSDCLAEPYQEGARALARGLAVGLASHSDLLALGTHAKQAPGNEATWMPLGRDATRAVRDHHPDVLLTFPHASNTVLALARSRALARRTEAATHAFIAYQPRRHGALGVALQRLVSPDLMLCLSEATARRLGTEGVRAARIPCGVDQTRFAVVDGETKRRLRKKHGLPVDRKIALHAGHAKPGRNLDLMVSACAAAGWMGLFVLSTFDRADPDVMAMLEAADVPVLYDMPAVEESYQLADCYVFPVHDERSCSEMPMSVLEALSCGLPVVSTPFRGLPDLLPSCEGLTYAETEAEFAAALKAIPTQDAKRPPAMNELTWHNIGAQVLDALEAARE